jgi:Domain of unknown function (DUF4167)
MRNGQNKRMRGRNRNKGGHHGHHHNPLTRVYESNGPDVKIRGTAHHVAEKYLQLARDAQASGDPVTAENHFQHAEHYYRLIAAAQEQLRQQNPYYQAPALPGESNRDDSSDGDDEEGVSLPIPGQPNFGSQAQPYPTREQPQPYSGPQPQQQDRGPNQPYQQYQQPQQPPQPYQQQPQQAQPAGADVSDGERLPSFITGSQPQQSPPGPGPNGYDGQGGERFPRHRRRRHRGSPRPDAPNVAQDFRSDDGPDDPRPGNS